MANALQQFKQLKPTHEMFDSCRNCGALQGVHENASLGEAHPGLNLDCPQEKGSKPRVRMLRELLQGEGWYGGEA